MASNNDTGDTDLLYAKLNAKTNLKLLLQVGRGKERYKRDRGMGSYIPYSNAAPGS